MNTTLLSRPPRAVGGGVSPAPDPLAATGPVVGVRTTRIYCRMFCRPGRAPRPENCVPMPHAAAARAEGFRPCKRCRPDEAAGRPVPPETIRYGLGPTPFGHTFVALSDRGIVALYLLDGDDPAPGLARVRAGRPVAELVEDAAAVRALLPRIVDFVYGESPVDPDLPLDVRGTPFQRRVWDALRAIPRGETRTYGAVADELGIPGAARAVGSACGANPVALLIPCHRVVRAGGGGMGGYEWGLDVKRALLDLEGALPRV